MSAWRDFLNGGEPEGDEPKTEDVVEGEVEPKVEDVAPATASMSVDAVQAMLDRNAEQMNQHFTALVSGLQTSLAPKDEHPTVAMPSDEDFKKALDEGDTAGFLRLQRQKDVAMATIYDNRLTAQEAASNERMLALQERVVSTSVPDEYKKEVDGMMDELGITRDLRTNPKVLELLTLAAKGKNADAIAAAAVEAAKRQANDDPVGDVSSQGRAVGGHEKPEPVFSDQAHMALQSVGRDGDAFAKGMGYKDWADYENATRNLMTAEEVVTHRWMKKGKK